MGKFVYMWHSCIWWKELPHPNPNREIPPAMAYLDDFSGYSPFAPINIMWSTGQ